jgi:hypothetical protein
MDKVRAFFNVVWQQRFWVLSVVGVVVAAICWQMSSSSLDAEFVTNKQQIDGQFTAMSAITGKSVHGNDEVNNAERSQAIQIRDKVLELWKTMYDRQTEVVLKWPAELGDDFLAAVEGKRFLDPIGNEQRQRYRTYAKDRFPKLVEIVHAKKLPETDLGFGGGMEFGRGDEGRGGGRGGDFSAGISTMEDIPQYDADGNLIEPEKYIVQWADQAKLRGDLDFKQLPSAKQVWVTQENLWVYETLLHAINDTNEARDATRPDNAAIRFVLALDVGQDAAPAAKEPGNVILPAGAGGDPAALGMDGSMGRGDMGMDGRGEGVDLDTSLLQNRYVDAEGAPIADASTDTGGECRRLPVRMQLYMNQRAIPDLLAMCANAALPIEVQRVRINPAESGAGFDATLAVAGPEGGGMTDSGGRGSMDGGGRGGGYGGGGGGRGGMDGMSTVPMGGSSPGMATVEVTGIVYIYNPPDATVLSVPGGDTTDVAASDATTAAL